MRLVRLLVVVACALSISTDAWALGCGFRCNREYSGDAAECVSARFLGQSNCRVVSNCSIVVVDPDGPFGPDGPFLQWVCTYDCAFDPCTWV